MRINDVIWLDEIVEKIERKHGVTPEEVEEVFCGNLRYRMAERGRVEGEDLYHALGRTDAGRYLMIVFIYKRDRNALVISARDMDDRERKRYGRK